MTQLRTLKKLKFLKFLHTHFKYIIKYFVIKFLILRKQTINYNTSVNLNILMQLLRNNKIKFVFFIFSNKF